MCYPPLHPPPLSLPPSPSNPLVQVSSDPGNQYSVSLMNSLVLYVGTQAIGFIHSKGNTPSTSTIAHTAHMDIFQHLVVDLDTEGIYQSITICTCILKISCYYRIYMKFFTG